MAMIQILNKRTSRVAIALATTGVMAALGAVNTPVHAAGAVSAPTAINLVYDFHGNGFRILRLKFNVELGRDVYEAGTVMKSKGLASLFSRTKTIANVAGRLSGRRLLPQRFEMRSKKKFELSWARDGKIKVERNYELDAFKARAIAENVKPGMPDPITALLSAAVFDKDKPCASRHRVYNGKEIFALNYRLLGRDTLNGDRAGAYRGPAYVCEIAYQPIAGLSERKMKERVKEPLGPFKIWMAPVAAKSLADPLLLPVRIEARINWIDTVAKLRRGSINGTPLMERDHARN